MRCSAKGQEAESSEKESSRCGEQREALACSLEELTHHAADTTSTDILDGRDGDVDDLLDVALEDGVLLGGESVISARRHDEETSVIGTSNLKDVTAEVVHLLDRDLDDSVVLAEGAKEVLLLLLVRHRLSANHNDRGTHAHNDVGVIDGTSKRIEGLKDARGVAQLLTPKLENLLVGTERQGTVGDLVHTIQHQRTSSFKGNTSSALILEVGHVLDDIVLRKQIRDDVLTTLRTTGRRLHRIQNQSRLAR